MRPVAAGDAEAWVRLRTELWPESPDDHRREVPGFLREKPENEECFVAEDGHGMVVGFAEVRLRAYAEGCLTSPVGYLEGIYVAPDHRRSGHARGLVRAGEAWARRHGCTEFASDRALDNEASGAFHEAAGFHEVERVVCYRKDL